MWRTRFLIPVLVTISLSAPAGAATFAFAFGDGVDHVAGIVRGLQASDASGEATGSAATSVRVTSSTAGFGLGEWATAPDVNAFVVLGGRMIDDDFLARRIDGPRTLVLDLWGGHGALSRIDAAGTQTIAGQVSYRPAPVPAPAPLLLLGAAIAVLAGTAGRVSGRTRFRRSRRPAGASGTIRPA